MMESSACGFIVDLMPGLEACESIELHVGVVVAVDILTIHCAYLTRLMPGRHLAFYFRGTWTRT